MIASLLLIPVIIGQFLLVLYVVCKALYWKTRYSHAGLFESGKICVAFFHPYCNAGGGGERVLWCAIHAIQIRYPHINCVIYTGDLIPGHLFGDDILSKAADRFNIKLPKPVTFIPLYKRWLLEARIYPHFTLLGQSLGSVLVGLEAMYRFTPDIYIDTMGYAFTLPLFRYMAGSKVACYVHYPTISTDMLDIVSSHTQSFNNAQFISHSPLLTHIKLIYYKCFAHLYSLCGACSEAVMVNSTWTKGHIGSLWSGSGSPEPHIVYPPCDTEEFLSLSRWHDESSEGVRVVSVAQFRPEKDHTLQLEAFARYLGLTGARQDVTVVLIGGCRDKEDERRVEYLRKLAKELGVESQVEFRLNIPFSELKLEMSRAMIGLHTMKNEHFGIGVVELQAAGCIVIAHDSGGPRMDIVLDGTTGFLATTADQYARTMRTIVGMTEDERRGIRAAARERAADRFNVQRFIDGFIQVCGPILTHQFTQ